MSITSPDGITTSLRVVVNNHLTDVTYPDDSTYSFTYTPDGLMTDEYDLNDNHFEHRYDEGGDVNGNMTLIVTPKETSHTFGYTGNDQRKEYAPPISGRYRYVFDKERKLKTLTYPSGSQILNTYTDGLLTETVTPESTIDFTYGCASLLSGVIKGTETVAYTYDGPLLKRDTRSGILNQTINYTYDNDFRPSTITYAGLTDILGRLREVKENNSIVESYEYDANGNRTRETNTARGITDKAFDYTMEV